MYKFFKCVFACLKKTIVSLYIVTTIPHSAYDKSLDQTISEIRTNSCLSYGFDSSNTNLAFRWHVNSLTMDPCYLVFSNILPLTKHPSLQFLSFPVIRVLRGNCYTLNWNPDRPHVIKKKENENK